MQERGGPGPGSTAFSTSRARSRLVALTLGKRMNMKVVCMDPTTTIVPWVHP